MRQGERTIIRVQDLSLIGMGNGVNTPVPGSSFILPEGKYIISWGGRFSAVASALPTYCYASIDLMKNGSAITIAQTGLPRQSANNMVALYARSSVVTSDGTDEYSLQVLIATVGGTVTSRDLQNCYMIIRKVEG